MGGTPWHAHHIAERYGLLVIIALGEGLIGTIASLTALVGPEGVGWSVDAALVAVAGTALPFGMWWIYFIVPSAQILHVHRERSFGWGYGHIPLIGAVVAMGAGLHIAAYYLEEESELGAAATVLSVVVPVSIYILGIFLIYTVLTRSLDRFHVLLIAVSAVFVVVPLVMAGERGRDGLVPDRAGPRPVGHRDRLRAARARAQRARARAAHGRGVLAMRLLVTGSAGHLGEALVRVLGAEGHEVVGLDVLAVAAHDRRRLDRRPRARARRACGAPTPCSTPRRCTSRTSARTAARTSSTPTSPAR